MRCALVIVVAIAIAAPPPQVAAEKVRSQPPSKTLDRATKLYDKADYLSASIELAKVLAGETADDPANVQRARFFMAKTLYQLRFYTSAQLHLDQIVNAGADHPYRLAAVKWILGLVATAPAAGARGLDNLLGSYSEVELDELRLELDDLRLELDLARARHALDKDDFAAVVTLLAGVDDGRARWLEGVAQHRLGKSKDAELAFAKAAVGKDKPSAALALLGLARGPAAAGEHAKAIDLYRKIPADAVVWPDAVLEASAMQLAKDRALGALAPFVAGGLGLGAPGGEPGVLAIVAWADFCRAGARKDLVAAVAKDWKKVRAELEKLREIGSEDSTEFYDLVVRIDAGKSGLSPLAEALVAVMVRRSPLIRLHRDLVAALAAEEQLWNGSDAAWRTTAVAADVLQEIVLIDALAKATVGKLAAERLGVLISNVDALLVAAGKKPPKLATVDANGKKAVGAKALLISPAVCR